MAPVRALPETLTIVVGKTCPFSVGHRLAGCLVDIMLPLGKGLGKNRATLQQYYLNTWAQPYLKSHLTILFMTGIPSVIGQLQTLRT